MILCKELQLKNSFIHPLGTYPILIPYLVEEEDMRVMIFHCLFYTIDSIHEVIAHGLEYETIRSGETIEETYSKVKEDYLVKICEVMFNPDQKLIQRAADKWFNLANEGRGDGMKTHIIPPPSLYSFNELLDYLRLHELLIETPFKKS
jgi:hypothetical protein